MPLFDFDELEEVSPVSEVVACSATIINAEQPKVYQSQEVVADVMKSYVSSSTGAGLAKNGKKPMSRARMWFEIRRYMEAEPQKYYDSPDHDEWRTYFAKELLLKTAAERLQRDGFVVIDANIALEYFNRLVRKLLNLAPEQAASLEEHVDHCRVGLMDDDEYRVDNGDMDKTDALAAMHLGGTLSESVHDRALCESCLLSLAHDREGSSALRPRTKQQFLQFFKAFLHEVAASSMDRCLRDLPKIPVQLCFGNMPSPKAALTGPPQLKALTETTQ